MYRRDQSYPLRLLLLPLMFTTLVSCSGSRGVVNSSLPKSFEEFSKDELRVFCRTRAKSVVGVSDPISVDSRRTTPAQVIRLERLFGAAQPEKFWSELNQDLSLVVCTYSDDLVNAAPTYTVCPDGSIASVVESLDAYFNQKGERVLPDWQPTNPLVPCEPL